MMHYHSEHSCVLIVHSAVFFVLVNSRQIYGVDSALLAPLADGLCHISR